MLKIRPITGNLEKSIQLTSAIEPTLTATIEWLQKMELCEKDSKYINLEDFSFIKHGHSNDAEWANGYMIRIGDMPVAMISHEIPDLEHQIAVWH